MAQEDNVFVQDVATWFPPAGAIMGGGGGWLVEPEEEAGFPGRRNTPGGGGPRGLVAEVREAAEEDLLRAGEGDERGGWTESGGGLFH